MPIRIQSARPVRPLPEQHMRLSLLACLMISLCATAWSYNDILNIYRENGNTIENIGKELGKRNTTLPSYNTGGHSKASKEQGISNISSAAYFIIEFFKFIYFSFILAQRFYF